MMRCIVASAILAFLVTSGLALADDVQTVSGSVEFVSADAVEVAGQRAIVTHATSIVSDGHPIAINSVHVGMPAELEIDPADLALELRVKGAVE
jgi:hypothetical protein